MLHLQDNPSEMPQWGHDTLAKQQITDIFCPNAVHILPSLSMGGAERIVMDLTQTLAKKGVQNLIICLHKNKNSYKIPKNVKVIFAKGKNIAEKIRHINDILTENAETISGLPYYHVPNNDILRQMNETLCTDIIAVCHNAKEGWRHDPIIYNDLNIVRLVACCGENVQEDLKNHGINKPIIILKHTLDNSQIEKQEDPETIRKFLNLKEAFIIGMVGRIVPQKHYAKAIRILAEILKTYPKAHLVIMGGIEHSHEKLPSSLKSLAKSLSCENHVHFLGPVKGARKLYKNFDLYLNTSQWEGLSISIMEAQTLGVPSIISQNQNIMEYDESDSLHFIPKTAPLKVWCDKIISYYQKSDLYMREKNITLRIYRKIIKHKKDISFNQKCSNDALTSAAQWNWISSFQKYRHQNKTLFITGNLDTGGAQKSLVNLLTHFGLQKYKTDLAVCGKIGVQNLYQRLTRSGISVYQTQGLKTDLGLYGRMGRLLHLIMQNKYQKIVFWNMDPMTKALLCKIIHPKIKTVDVSPGPMLYKELVAEKRLKTYSITPESYIANLDALVSKYKTEGEYIPSQAKSHWVIPNGVRAKPSHLSKIIQRLKGEKEPTPDPNFPSHMSLVSVGRLVPAKRPELWVPIAKELERICPQASLTIIGGTHNKDKHNVWNNIQKQGIPKNLRFIGPRENPERCLENFKLFLMFSTDQGCPNASLEALSCGLPVIANANGGTAEQITTGYNGWLVEDIKNPEDYAIKIANVIKNILEDQKNLNQMQKNAKDSSKTFSMKAMVKNYKTLLNSL